MEEKFFKTPKTFRSWLEKHHLKKQELWVMYYKKGTGKASITWPESVEQALCFGWIDGIRKSVDEEVYKIRFTPRKATSIWSSVNLKTVNKLIDEGLMHDAGLEAYNRRNGAKSGVYSFEQDNIQLDSKQEKLFKSNKVAWNNFNVMAPSYKKGAIWWVVSAKREETRLKRLTELISDSENGLKIKLMRR
ncbi:MAG: YdeI/OmpD-associated family protein [Chitinophagales bacterium]|nr:YdeI/OmpD-associated family protein [Chitinophagales bacterium]